jgi:hypothetical protein
MTMTLKIAIKYSILRHHEPVIIALNGFDAPGQAPCYAFE